MIRNENIMNPKTLLSVKNMVCNRCIRVVREDLEKLGFSIESLELGKLSLIGEISEKEYVLLGESLKSSGFELIEDRLHKLIESVKTLIIEHIHHKKQKPAQLNFSDYLAKETGVNYFELSRLFSSIETITIEKYIIRQKIERVKELLIYGEQQLGEIAFELGYSSVAHLSGQFKKVTGLSTSAFRKLSKPQRKSLDEL